MSGNDPRLPLGLVFPVWAVYVVIVAVGLYNHELWLDESHHFLIGRDSDSLGALYWNMRYDGHPRLWNFLLYFVTHYISPSYIGMQVLHGCIAAAAAWLFLRYAPFTLLQKVLVLSGYYFVFEYSVISRNYALGILLLFAVCILLRHPRKNILYIGALLFVMSNTHLFFAFAALGVYFYMAMEVGRREWLRGRFLLFTVLFAAGFILVIIQTQTPPDDNYNQLRPEEWLTGQHLSFTAFSLIRGWLPIPQVRGGHFWNSYWINPQHIGGWLRNALFVFFLVYPAFVLRKGPKALVFYYTALVFLLAFFDVTQQAGSRLFGMAYIYFLAASWMADAGMGRVMYAVLILHIGIGVIALEQDLTRPFSQSRNTVEYLKGHHLADSTIVVDGYECGPMISAYLGRKVYSITQGAEYSYLNWTIPDWPSPRPSLSQEITRSPYLQSLDRYTLVSSRQLDTATVQVGDKKFRIKAIKEFLNSIRKEDYYVYQVSATGSDPRHPLP